MRIVIVDDPDPRTGEGVVAELEDQMADGRYGHLLMRSERRPSAAAAVESLRPMAARLGYRIDRVPVID